MECKKRQFFFGLFWNAMGEWHTFFLDREMLLYKTEKYKKNGKRERKRKRSRKDEKLGRKK